MEIWKDIEGYEGLYQVSNMGRVKSLKRKDRYGRIIKEKIRNLQNGKDGYLIISLWNNGKGRMYSVHRLVAETFIPNPDSKPVVNHIDGNKQNNNADNLEWCTNSENDLHAYRLGLRTVNKTGIGRFGRLNGASKSIYMLDKNTEKIIRKFDSLASAGRFFERKANQMSHIAQQIRGERKTAYGYKWRYANEIHNKQCNKNS